MKSSLQCLKKIFFFVPFSVVVFVGVFAFLGGWNCHFSVICMFSSPRWLLPQSAHHYAVLSTFSQESVSLMPTPRFTLKGGESGVGRLTTGQAVKLIKSRRLFCFPQQWCLQEKGKSFVKVHTLSAYTSKNLTWDQADRSDTGSLKCDLCSAVVSLEQCKEINSHG